MQQASFPDTLVVYYGLISLLEINSMTPRREESDQKFLRYQWRRDRRKISQGFWANLEQFEISVTKIRCGYHLAKCFWRREDVKRAALSVCPWEWEKQLGRPKKTKECLKEILEGLSMLKRASEFLAKEKYTNSSIRMKISLFIRQYKQEFKRCK